MENTATIFDEDIAIEKDAPIKIEDVESASNPVMKPKPYTEWIVAGETYKLKLTAGVIIKLESQFKTGLLNAVIDEGIPEIGMVIPLLQGALQKYQHGMKSNKVEDLYDAYIAEGHSIIDLLSEVIYPLMFDAGFFTAAQMEMLSQTMSEVDAEL